MTSVNVIEYIARSISAKKRQLVKPILKRRPTYTCVCFKACSLSLTVSFSVSTTEEVDSALSARETLLASSLCFSTNKQTF